MKNPEIIVLAKIKEGFFIGDNIAGTNIEILKQYKITHIINTTGDKNLNVFEANNIKYFNLNWYENPNQQLFELNENNIIKLLKFIDNSYKKGEGLLVFSMKCQNRACIVAIIYLIKIYNWSVNKCIEYIESKKIIVSIPAYFMKQLNDFEFKNSIHSKIKKSTNWNEENNKLDYDEFIMRNTFINTILSKNVKLKIKNYNNYLINNSQKAIKFNDEVKNDNMNNDLFLINKEVDLFLKKDIKEIDNHIIMKPKKSCCKFETKQTNKLKKENSITFKKSNSQSNITSNTNNVNSSLKNSLLQCGIKEKKQKKIFCKNSPIKNNNFIFNNLFHQKSSSFVKLPIKIDNNKNVNHDFSLDNSKQKLKLNNSSINIFNNSLSMTKLPSFSPSNSQNIKKKDNSKRSNSPNKKKLFYRSKSSFEEPIKINNQSERFFSPEKEKKKLFFKTIKNDLIRRPLSSAKERKRNNNNQLQKNFKRIPSPDLKSKANLRYYYNNINNNNNNNSSLPEFFLSYSIGTFVKLKI